MVLIIGIIAQNMKVGDKDKILLPEEYFNMIRPYLRDIINNHKTQELWKFIQVIK